jgi:hypothetical protein
MLQGGTPASRHECHIEMRCKLGLAGPGRERERGKLKAPVLASVPPGTFGPQ